MFYVKETNFWVLKLNQILISRTSEISYNQDENFSSDKYHKKLFKIPVIFCGSKFCANTFILWLW